MDMTEIVDKYMDWVEFSKMKYNAPTWVLISIASTIVVGVFTFLITLLLVNELTLIPLAFSLATLVLLIGYPYMRKETIVDSIESNFSDALKQMADTLKAGDTYEGALREIVDADYGRLSEEMQLALRRLEDGETLENALNGFAQRIDSRLIKRTMTIILDSIKTGASLAEILDEIGDDVRDFHRLKEERKSNTLMQFLFMVAAGGVIAPLIFGEINAVLSAFSRFSTETLNPAQVASASKAGEFTLILIQIYLIVEVIGSGAMMSLIREGKLNKSIIYIPILLLVAFIMYHISSFAVKTMISGTV
jgi:flagellar protein FlaJ